MGKNFFFLTFFLLFSFLSHAGSIFNFPRDEGRHKGVKMEFWGVYAHLTDSENKRTGIGVMLFDGKWLFLSGKIIAIGVSEETRQKFTYKTEPFIFGGVKHNENMLDENYGKSFLRRESDSNKYKLKVDLEDIKAELTMELSKNPMPINETGTAEWENHWTRGYSLPGLEVSGVLTRKGKTTRVYGVGQLDHFWSNSMEEDHDFIIIQLENNTQITVLFRHDLDGNGPLEGSGVGISYPDSSMSFVKSGDFKLAITDWWVSPKTKKKYPAGMNIEIPSENIKINISPTFNNQEASLMGMAFWNGTGLVEASVKAFQVNGRAYLILQGYGKGK